MVNDIIIKTSGPKLKVDDISIGIKNWIEEAKKIQHGSDLPKLLIATEKGNWEIEPLISSDNFDNVLEIIKKNPEEIISHKSLTSKNAITLMQESGISKNGEVYLHNLSIDKRLNKIFNVKPREEFDTQKKKIKDWIGGSDVKSLINFFEKGSAEKFIEQQNHDLKVDDVNKASEENVQGWIYQSKKSGGANSAGEYGGIYKKGDEIALIKKEEDITSNIVELLASEIFQKTAPGYGAEVFLANFGKIPDESGNNIYVASKFFKNYKDLYIDAYESTDKKIPSDRPRNVGSFNRDDFINALSRNNYKYYSGFPQSIVTSLLIGDFDVHWGNLGVVKEKDRKKLVRIDFGWALKKLSGDLEPHSILNHLPGFGPTNHFREYPEEMKFTPEFVEELKRVSKIDLKETLDKVLKNLCQFYGIEPMKSLAKAVGMKKNFSSDIKKEEISTNIKTYLIETLQKRQQSLHDFATEIEIDICFKKDSKGKHNLEKDEEHNIKNAICDNPDYFKKILSGEKEIHLRSREHKGRDKWRGKNIFLDIMGKLGFFYPIEKLYIKYLNRKLDRVIRDSYKDFIENPDEIEKWKESKQPNKENIPGDFTKKDPDKEKEVTSKNNLIDEGIIKENTVTSMIKKYESLVLQDKEEQKHTGRGV